MSQHYTMDSDEKVAEMNKRVAAIMRERSLDARTAIEHVAFEQRREGGKMIDRTDPQDTSGGYIELYQLFPSNRCVNMWLVSQFANASDITDPDVLASLGIGFDNQSLDWGWPEEEGQPDFIDADGREWL